MQSPVARPRSGLIVPVLLFPLGVLVACAADTLPSDKEAAPARSDAEDPKPDSRPPDPDDLDTDPGERAEGSGAGDAESDTTVDAKLDPESDGRATEDGSGGDAEPRYYRITQLWLRDPRFVVGTMDITDEPFLGQSVNGSLIPAGLTMDYRGDGFADVSLVLGLEPPDPAGEATSLLVTDADCMLSALEDCRAQEAPTLHTEYPLEHRDTGTCLAPIDGTTEGFEERGALPEGPCFLTREPRELVIDLGAVRLELTAAVIAASYAGGPAARLTNGLIKGFLSEARADGITLPNYLPLLANTALSGYLRESDQDNADSPDGEDGWWVYLNFEAEPVSYVATR